MKKHVEERIEITGDQRGIYGRLKAVENGGVRLVISRGGRAEAALVSFEDFLRLEKLDAQEEREDYTTKTSELRNAFEAVGLVVSVPSGREPWRGNPIKTDGPPISDQIIADRR